MTMTATPTLQPHPLDDPDARGLYLTAELVAVVGYTAALVAIIGAGAQVWHPAVFLLSLPIVIVTSLGTRRLQRSAWEATPGAFGRRSWAAPRNPARLLRPLGDALVVGGAGFWLLNVRPSDNTHTIVLCFAAYVGGFWLGSIRRPIDLPAIALRLATPLLLIGVATIRLPFAASGSLMLAAFVALLSATLAYLIPRR